MSDSTDDLPFSQRYGYAPVVQQLALGEITTPFKEELKALLDWAIPDYGDEIIDISCTDMFKDIFINICGGSYQEYYVNNDEFSLKKSFVNKSFSSFINNCEFFKLFDLLEELMKNNKKLNKDNIDHKKNNKNFEFKLKKLFKKHHLAYTIYNGKIEPISSEFEGKTYVAALDETKDTGQLGAHSHLIKAGEQINHEKWADSVRESISAVEAVCRQIVGGEKSNSRFGTKGN
nr:MULTISPECIES: hypothetical protein [Bartonella]